MQRKWVKYIALFIILNIVFGIVLNNVFNAITPPVLNEAVEYFSTDSNIDKKIGGYRSFKYTFDGITYDVHQPTKFELQIIGYERGVKLIGTLEYINSKWRITDSDTLYSEFK